MSETVTAHAVRVGEKSQEPDGHAKGQASASVRSKDGSRGGHSRRSFARPRLRLASLKLAVSPYLSLKFPPPNSGILTSKPL